MADTTRRARVLLLAGLAAFVVLLGYLLAASLTRRAAPTFAPTPSGVARTGPPGAPDTLTVDGRAEDRWRYVDLDTGMVLAPDDSAGWDLAVRRFRIRAARGVRDLAPGPDSAPAGSARPEFGRWYSYSMLSHLLRPSGRTFVVRTSEGGEARVEILSYYCPGLEAGCLTIRSALLRPSRPGPEASPR